MFSLQTNTDLSLRSDQTGQIHTLAGSGLNSELFATHGAQLGSSGVAQNNTASMNVQTNSKCPIALQSSSIQSDQEKEEATEVARKFQLKIPVGFMPFPDYIFSIGAMEGSQLLPHALNFLSNHYLGGPPPLPVVNGHNTSLLDLYEMYSKVMNVEVAPHQFNEATNLLNTSNNTTQLEHTYSERALQKSFKEYERNRKKAERHPVRRPPRHRTAGMAKSSAGNQRGERVTER
ncbi:unnamed protein product [Caenorhabditis brenneri]